MPKIVTEEERRVHVGLRLPLALLIAIDRERARGTRTLTLWIEDAIRARLDATDYEPSEIHA